MDSIKDKSVLITGATGLIGSNLVDRLMQSDIAKLIVTGRSKKKLESTFPEYVEDERFVVVEHDASTPYPEDIKDIDFIFHTAGPTERNIVMNYPVNVILPNVLGTINTLEFLRNQEKETGRKGRAIIFSSVTVYNNPTKEDYVAVEEETSYAQSLDAATACYSESKRMSEVIAKAYVKQYGVDAVIARFSTVYGPTRNVPDTAFYEFIKKSIAGEDITVNSVYEG
jgi:nucleoside-diphosphate-sugar epimerase